MGGLPILHTTLNMEDQTRAPPANIFSSLNTILATTVVLEHTKSPLSVALWSKLQTVSLNKRYSTTDKWIEHIQQMDDNIILKFAFNYRPRGCRNVECPRKRQTE
jgi:hypothetical protein